MCWFGRHGVTKRRIANLIVATLDPGRIILHPRIVTALLRDFLAGAGRRERGPDSRATLNVMRRASRDFFHHLVRVFLEEPLFTVRELPWLQVHQT